MNEIIVKNRSGWTLHEYIDIPEEKISGYPNVTGAYAIVRVGGKYLIGYNSWRKQWEFPAGGIEKGETARQAAVRELYEETHQDDVAIVKKIGLGEQECKSSIIESTERKIEIIRREEKHVP